MTKDTQQSEIIGSFLTLIKIDLFYYGLKFVPLCLNLLKMSNSWDLSSWAFIFSENLNKITNLW